MRSTENFGEFPHCFLVPEAVVPPVIVVVVESIEGFLFPLTEQLIGRVFLCCDPWVEGFGLSAISQEEHVADESV